MAVMPGDQVTISDVFREVLAVRSDVSNVRSDVGQASVRLAVVEQRNAQADMIHEDHEARLRKQEDLEERQKSVAGLTAELRLVTERVRGLERFRWMLAGISAGAGATIGASAAIVAALIHHP